MYYEKSSGLLVLYNSVFRRNASTPRRSSSSCYIPTPSPSATADPKLAHSNSKRRRATSEESSLLVSANPSDLPLTAKPAAASYPHAIAPASNFQKPTRKQQGPLGRMPSISSELDSIIHDHQRSKGSSTLVRASSGNVMLFGNLGNIRAPGAVTSNRNTLMDHLPKTTKESGPNANGTLNGAAGSLAKGGAREAEAPEVLCRALSKRLDSEDLKEMGNEAYKEGRYAEAVALYDRAILVNPEIASYYSNKAAGTCCFRCF